LLLEGAGSAAGAGIDVVRAEEKLSAVLANVFAVICVAKSVATETSEAASASELLPFEAAGRVGSLFRGEMSAIDDAEKLSGREVGELKIFSLIFLLMVFLRQRYLRTGD